MGKRKELPKVEQHWLFPPITFWVGNIDVTDFTERFNKWIFDNGEQNDSRGMVTTWGSQSQPHKVPWIANYLKKISPIDTFINSWGQVYGLGGFHPNHNHQSDEVAISGCLYLEEGPGTMFQDPLVKNNNIFKRVHAGDFMLWSPHLYHCSPPCSQKRSILAFNLRDYNPR
jgi:hypothetical protein